MYNFTLYDQDTPLMRIEADREKKQVTFTELTSEREYLPLEFYGFNGEITNPTFENLEWFIRRRCFPRNHMVVNDLLRSLNLTRYDEWDIMKANHGAFSTDSMWCKFDGVDITWEELRS